MKKILIIDDDLHHIELCEMIIGHHFDGIETIHLTRIDDAYNVIVMEEPICIILDYMMPGGSGLVLLLKLRDNMKDCPPIIFVSCAMSDLLVPNAEALNAAICLSKLDAMKGGLVAAIEQLTGERRIA